MNKTLILSTILMLIILTAAFLVPSTLTNKSTETKPFYIGVTYCGNSTSEAKLLIDRVKTYTNLFVLQSFDFSRNETATKEICDYAVAQNLNIIVNFLNSATRNSSAIAWQLPLLRNAKQRWGNRFLGVYFDDEPGGIQLDTDWANYFASPDFAVRSQQSWFRNSSLYKIYQETLKPNVNSSTPKNYGEEAKWFTDIINWTLHPDQLKDQWKAAGITSFTSDWTLYWWDYLGGYDVILAQLGWNHTLTQDIALVKGAARMQNKSWGTIITWKYRDLPYYLDSGENIYQQMLMSYEAGATYVVIFNYPQIEGNPYGILKDEHFEALERFWNDVMTEPNKQDIPDYSQAEAALVLPENYGWGMRSPDDTIWGFWGPDERSPQIWEISRTLLEQYGLSLDIVYDDPDPAFSAAGKYSQIYYWNQTS
jgi:hypothetical protein